MSLKFTSKNTLKRIFSRISEIFIKKSDIVDNVTSTDTDKPLSANQGKVLNESISTLNSNMKVSPKGLKHISQNIATSGSQTNTATLEEGGYLIFQTHPTGQKAVYFVTCMNGYAGTVIPIIADSQSTFSMDASCNLTVSFTKTGVSGESNFRWWHIVKMCGLGSLGV